MTIKLKIKQRDQERSSLSKCWKKENIYIYIYIYVDRAQFARRKTTGLGLFTYMKQKTATYFWWGMVVIEVREWIKIRNGEASGHSNLIFFGASHEVNRSEGRSRGLGWAHHMRPTDVAIL